MDNCIFECHLLSATHRNKYINSFIMFIFTQLVQVVQYLHNVISGTFHSLDHVINITSWATKLNPHVGSRINIHQHTIWSSTYMYIEMQHCQIMSLKTYQCVQNNIYECISEILQLEQYITDQISNRRGWIIKSLYWRFW